MRSRVPIQKNKTPHSKAKTLSKRDRTSTEDKLLKAGTLVFSKYGYDAATTKLISAKSGVNESLIMRYFGGKEGLLLEILKRHFEGHRTTPLPYPPQESLKNELIQYAQYSYEHSKEHNEIFRIMFLRASVDPVVRRKVQALIPAEGNVRFAERINLLKEKKKIPQHLDPKFLSLIGFQCLSADFVSGLLFDDKTQKEIQDGLEMLISFTVDGLMKA